METTRDERKRPEISGLCVCGEREGVFKSEYKTLHVVLT